MLNCLISLAERMIFQFFKTTSQMQIIKETQVFSFINCEGTFSNKEVNVVMDDDKDKDFHIGEDCGQNTPINASALDNGEILQPQDCGSFFWQPKLA